MKVLDGHLHHALTHHETTGLCQRNPDSHRHTGIHLAQSHLLTDLSG